MTSEMLLGGSNISEMKWLHRTLPVPPFHFFDVTDEVVGVYEVASPSPTILFLRPLTPYTSLNL